MYPFVADTNFQPTGSFINKFNLLVELKNFIPSLGLFIFLDPTCTVVKDH